MKNIRQRRQGSVSYLVNTEDSHRRGEIPDVEGLPQGEALDTRKPYSIVHGMPRAKFQQAGKYYNAKGILIKGGQK